MDHQLFFLSSQFIGKGLSTMTLEFPYIHIYIHRKKIRF